MSKCIFVIACVGVYFFVEACALPERIDLFISHSPLTADSGANLLTVDLSAICLCVLLLSVSVC